MQRRPRSDDPALESIKPTVDGDGNRLGGRPSTVADEPPDRGEGQTPDVAVSGGRPPDGGLIGSTFASLKYRDFTYLWLGQLTHAFALWIDQIAKPLLIFHLGGGGVGAWASPARPYAPRRPPRNACRGDSRQFQPAHGAPCHQDRGILPEHWVSPPWLCWGGWRCGISSPTTYCGELPWPSISPRVAP